MCDSDGSFPSSVSLHVKTYKHSATPMQVSISEQIVKGISDGVLCKRHRRKVDQFLKDVQDFRNGTLLVSVFNGSSLEKVPVSVYYAKYYKAQ